MVFSVYTSPPFIHTHTAPLPSPLPHTAFLQELSNHSGSSAASPSDGVREEGRSGDGDGVRRRRREEVKEEGGEYTQEQKEAVLR